MTREDIESLGWKEDLLLQDRPKFGRYGKDNYMLGYDFENNRLGMIVKDLSKNDEYARHMTDPSIRNLTVNTKEELEVLMKQFGI